MLVEERNGPVDLLHAGEEGEYVAGLLRVVYLYGGLNHGLDVVRDRLRGVVYVYGVETTLDAQYRRRVRVVAFLRFSNSTARVEEVPKLLRVHRRRGYDQPKALTFLK